MAAARRELAASQEGFPEAFPTLPLDSLLQVTSSQQVCVQGKVSNIHQKTVGCKLPAEGKGGGKKRKGAAATAARHGDTKVEKELATADLQHGSVVVELQGWEEHAELVSDLVAGSFVQLDRVLWTQEKDGAGFVLKVAAQSEVRALQGGAADSVRDALSEAPRSFSSKASTGRSAEGPAKLTCLSDLAGVLEDSEPRKGMENTLWEVAWVHVVDVRNVSQEAATLHYEGCEMCSAKAC